MSKKSDIPIAMFIIITSAIVGLLSVIALADGQSGMGVIIIGCLACFVGGWVVVCEELSK